MDDHPPGGTGITIAPRQGNASQRCAICGRHPSAPWYSVAESDSLDDQRQSWLLCAACTEAVRDEVARAALQTPLRLRIAVGMVAAQRRPPARHSFWSEQYWKDLDDAALDRLLKRFIALAISVKMLTMVGIAIYVALAH
jgi:hypothetical protein